MASPYWKRRKEDRDVPDVSVIDIGISDEDRKAIADGRLRSLLA